MNAGFGREIDDISEITLDLLSEGIDECMCHEFIFEEAEEVLGKCGYIKEETPKENIPTIQDIIKALRELLSPMEVQCTVDGIDFQIGEDIRKALEEQYISFAAEWILGWECY